MAEFFENINQHHPDAIDAQLGKKTVRLMVWRFPRDGRFTNIQRIAVGTRSALSKLYDGVDEVNNNTRLSDQAKAEDAKALAVEALKDLGTRQRGLNADIEKNKAELLRIAAVPTYGGPTAAADAVIDIEIARSFAALKGDERTKFINQVMSGEYERELDAFVRLPKSLIQIEEKTLILLQNAALQRRDPNAVEEFNLYFEAVGAVQFVLRRTFDYIRQISSLTQEEHMKALGSNAWEAYFGDTPAHRVMAQRYGV